MNRIHNLLCSSGWWRGRAQNKLVPWGVAGLELGDRVLEVGPGFGATTQALARELERLDVVELDEGYCQHLREELPSTVNVTQGDATSLPYPDNSFSAVLCFTMLHHIPTPEAQNQAFAEVARVLAPGGVFAGTDSVGTGIVFKLLHIGDTMVLLALVRLARRVVFRRRPQWQPQPGTTYLSHGPLFACSAWIAVGGIAFAVAKYFDSDEVLAPTAAFDKYFVLQNLVTGVAIFFSLWALVSGVAAWLRDLRLITKIKFSLVALACMYLIFFALHYNVLGSAHRY